MHTPSIYYMDIYLFHIHAYIDITVTEVPRQSLSNSPDRHTHILFKVPTVIRRKVKRRIISPHVTSPLLRNTPKPVPPSSSLLQSISMEVINSSPESSGNKCHSGEPASPETTTHKSCDVHISLCDVHASYLPPLVANTQNFEHLTKSARVNQHESYFPENSSSHEKNKIHQYMITSFIQKNGANPKQPPQSTAKGTCRYSHNAGFYIQYIYIRTFLVYT